MAGDDSEPEKDQTDRTIVLEFLEPESGAKARHKAKRAEIDRSQEERDELLPDTKE